MLFQSNHDGESVRDLAIAAGRIAAIGDVGSAAAETIDCKALHILPGVIDSHVHFREPGLTHKEDLESGSRGAVLGGVTAVFEMPNTDPTTTNAEAVADKNWLWINDYKIPNGVHVFGRRYKPYGPDNYPFEIKKIREMKIGRAHV